MTYYCGGCEKPYESTSNNGLVRSTCPRCNPGKTGNIPLPYCRTCMCVKSDEGCGCDPEGA